jgi:hypothetical protein
MGRLRAGLLIGLTVALGLSFSAVDGFAADPAPAAKAAAKKAPKPPKKMTINGISSGVLRLPVVTVWECAGGAMGGCNPSGEIKHGTPVLRHKFEKARGHKWAYITGEGIKGWIRKELLAKIPAP